MYEYTIIVRAPKEYGRTASAQITAGPQKIREPITQAKPFLRNSRRERLFFKIKEM